jgi:hypothetical protein
VLAVHVRLTVCVGAAVPVPVADSVVVVDCALLVKLSVAVAAPVELGSNDTVYGTLEPAAIVTGSDRPLRVNAELLLLAAVTRTLAPLAANVPDPVPVNPTTTLPIAIVAGEALSVPAGATPVPESGIVKVEFEAVDVRVREPLALPAAEGSNATLKVAPWPEDKLTGAVIPLKVKPVPLTATCEIVMLELPVLVTVSDSDLVWPSVSLPKDKLDGLGLNAPVVSPVPLSAIVSDEFEAFDVIVTVPLAAPLVWGAKVIVKVVLCDGLTVTGALIPLSWKPDPVIAACVMLTAVPPVLLMVKVWLCCDPTCTLPNALLAGLDESVPAELCWTPAPVRPTVAGDPEAVVNVRVAL